MKKLYHFILSMVVVLCVSCSTTEKFLVSGVPNTEIYTPSYKQVGTIGSDGKANIELESDHYYAFLLSKSPDSEKYTPFALDCEDRDCRKEKSLNALGLSMVIGGGTCEMLIGLPMAAAGSAAAVPLVLGGGAVALAGLPVWVPQFSKLEQTTYKYQFKYAEQQKINSDLNFTEVVFTEPFRTNIGTNDANVPQKPSSEGVEEVSVSRKQLTQKTSRTFNDYGRQLAKEYVGTGELKLNNSTVESYNNIRVVIKRTSKNEVQVNVVESNGSEYFDNYSTYRIEKKENGSFLLIHSTIQSATITIDTNGNLKYNHPKVNIDGDVYELHISAK